MNALLCQPFSLFIIRLFKKKTNKTTVHPLCLCPSWCLLLRLLLMDVAAGSRELIFLGSSCGMFLVCFPTSGVLLLRSKIAQYQDVTQSPAERGREEGEGSLQPGTHVGERLPWEGSGCRVPAPL